MTTVDFITELFCQVDDQIGYLPKHSQARLYPSEVVTLALVDAGLSTLVSQSVLSHAPLSSVQQPALPDRRISGAALLTRRHRQLRH